MMRLASAIYGGGVHPFMDFGMFGSWSSVVDPAELLGHDALVVWGGEDISPSLYKQRANRSATGARDEPSRRDRIEWDLMQQAIKYGIPIIGVCRGGQMLCAAAGGTLYQHVDGHTNGRHQAETIDGKTIMISSLHHQMMNPEGTNHEMWMWSKDKRSDTYVTQDGPIEDPLQVVIEPEYVYFPDIKGHAIQWHPEFHEADEACNVWLAERWKEKF